MTGVVHGIASYMPPVSSLAHGRLPGKVTCTCSAFLEDAGLTEAGANRWIKEHPQNEPSGAREVCLICTDGPIVLAAREQHDNIALCDRHWNQWVTRFALGDEDPPCSAHLIRPTPPEDSGARELGSTGAAVIAHDFGHVAEEATRIAEAAAARWVGADEHGEDAALAEVTVANAIVAACEQIAHAATEQAFTAEQLHTLDRVPLQLGAVLASIDPERAR